MTKPLLNNRDEIVWWITNETADRVVDKILEDRQRIAELENIGKQIMELAWRDHKSMDELALLKRADKIFCLGEQLEESCDTPIKWTEE